MSIEMMWNNRDVAARFSLLERLGLSYKIKHVDSRLFEELPQLQQKWLIHTADIVL